MMLLLQPGVLLLGIEGAGLELKKKAVSVRASIGSRRNFDFPDNVNSRLHVNTEVLPDDYLPVPAKLPIISSSPGFARVYMTIITKN